jgi:hypothetical protein
MIQSTTFDSPVVQQPTAGVESHSGMFDSFDLWTIGTVIIASTRGASKAS